MTEGHEEPTGGTGALRLEVDGAEYEIRGPASLQPSVLRVLFGTTPLDRAVDEQAPPREWQRRASVRALRWYRRHVAVRMADRCVMDPSCSRYAEQAIRRVGVARGGIATVGRLRRCRPGHGASDLPAEWLPPGVALPTTEVS